jgi:hypothetical protein
LEGKLSSIEGDEFFIFDAKEIEKIVRKHRLTEKKTQRETMPAWAKHSVHATVWRIPLPKKDEQIKPFEKILKKNIEKKNEAHIMVLNHKKIKELRKESESVSKILKTIFSNNDTGEAPGETVRVSSNILSLDDAHTMLLYALLKKEAWRKKEWEALAKKFNLLPDGAIETINEKAYLYFDEALIACDSDLYINTELLKKQKE